MKQHPILDHILVSEDGLEIFSKKSNKIQKQYKNDNGYMMVNITIATNKYKRYRVHRLVAETYHGYMDNSVDVNHIDHDKTNNHKDNLEWCNRSHNIKEAIRYKVNPSIGETHPYAKYDEDTINEVCRLICFGHRNVDIARRLDVDNSTVAKIRSGEAWTHISSNYEIPEHKRRNRLSIHKVKKICELLQEDKSNVFISKEVGLSLFTISKIRARKIYQEVSKDYSF